MNPINFHPAMFRGLPRRLLTTVAAGVLAFLLAGCHSVEVTKPKRTMAEQLLLSTAADRSVEGVDLSVLREKRVFVDDRYFDSVDKPYVIGTIRELISTNGAYLVSSVDRADIVVEPRSGALGIDTRETLFGVPSIPFPIPFAGTVTTPEISIFKSEKADSLGKFALLAYERESGDHVHSSGSMVGVAQFHYYRVLSLIHWRQTDIPELDPRVWRRLRQAALTAGGEEAPE